MFTTYIDFSDIQGQVTLQSMVEIWTHPSFNACPRFLLEWRWSNKKMKALECWHFTDAQGQLTPQSSVRSGRISNSSEISWLSLLVCKIEKWRRSSVDNMKHRSSRCSRAANSIVLCRIWPNFELICTLMIVLITCKNEEDPIKNEGAKVLTKISPL